MGGPLIDGCNVESGQFRTLPSRKSRSWIDRMPRIVRGQACYHHHRPENPAAYADLVEPASPAVLDARNLYRDTVQEREEGADCLGQKAPFESDHRGEGSVIRPASPSLI